MESDEANKHVEGNGWRNIANELFLPMQTHKTIQFEKYTQSTHEKCWNMIENTNKPKTAVIL